MADLDSKWWEVVGVIAELIGSDYDSTKISEECFVGDLANRGYRYEDIEQAHLWIEKVIVSGNFAEVMTMLKPGFDGIRVANPIEIACLPKHLWQRIESCRQQGILSDELVEKLLEGVRMLDTRDLDDEEASILLAEFLNMVLPSSTYQECINIVTGKGPEYYC